MSSSDFFYGIADFLTWTFGFFEWIGNKFNYSMIVLGFFGLVFMIISPTIRFCLTESLFFSIFGAGAIGAGKGFRKLNLLINLELC
jgi:hypothetical protein